MKTVYILDGDTAAQNRRDWSALIGRPFTAIRWHSSQMIDAATNAQLPSDAAGVVFIHTSYCPASELPELSAKYPGLILAALNAGGIPNGPRGVKYWSVGTPVGKRPTDLSFAARAKGFLDDFAKRNEPDFRKLEPNSEPILSLRLLCEAWLLAHRAQIDATQLDQNVLEALGCNDGISLLPTDISFVGPAIKDDWMAPFQTADASKIAIQMPDGPSQEAVQTFFGEFTDNSPGVAQVTALFLALHTFTNKNL